MPKGDGVVLKGVLPNADVDWPKAGADPKLKGVLEVPKA